MNSPIKLPPLPEPRIVSYQADSTLLYTELRTYDDADMRAYAEQAVREALAAQVPVAWIAMVGGDPVDRPSRDRGLVERSAASWADGRVSALAIIPENNHD
ncbi:hypothetical protein WJ973_23800 [Achromobacter xylosoxidans]